jgi:nucleotide-binding universal stress UspA family protein
MFRRILVPLDGSGRAEEALPVAARMARNAGASILLLRVIDTSTESMPTVPTRPSLFQSVGQVDQVQAESYLAAVAASEQFLGIAVQTQTQFGLVAPTILSVAAAQQADIIVLCSHGFSGVTRWVMGSVAEKVARYSDIPVLVLREGGPTNVAMFNRRSFWQPLRSTPGGSIHFGNILCASLITTSNFLFPSNQQLAD